MDVQTELKRIEQEEAQLLERRRRLEEKLERERKMEERLEEMFKTSGYATPRDLVIALATKFNVRVGSLKKAVERSASLDTGGRRTRTKVTAELRDQLKGEIADKSLNQISKETGISYMTLAKIRDGKYDHL